MPDRRRALSPTSLACFVASLAALLAVAPAAQAANPGPYATVHAGGAGLDDSNEAFGSRIAVRYESGDGFVAGGAVGYRFPWVRLEGAVDYLENSFDSFNPQGAGFQSGSGEASLLTLGLNLALEYDLPYVMPWIGGGIGIGFSEIELGNAASLLSENQNESFVWNLSAGLSVPLANHIEFTVGYRFQGIGSADTGVRELQAHQGLIGLRFTLANEDERNLLNLLTR